MTELQKAIEWLEETKKASIIQEGVFYITKPPTSYFAVTADNCRILLDALRWVPVSERKPTNADSDENGQVIAFSRFGCCIVHWTTLSTRTPFTHWRPLLPKPPESEVKQDG